MSVTNDTADNGIFTDNGGFDVSGESTLIQPEKRILLNIGEQSNYTILPALREDVYTISSVGNVNGLFANYPVPHTWNYDVSGDRHIEVDAWADSDVAYSTPNSADAASFHVRDRLFNQFKASVESNMSAHVLGSAHEEMTLDPSGGYSLANVGQKNTLRLMQTYGDSSGMLSTASYFNEYLTDDGLVTGTPLDTSATGINPSGSTNGTMFGQLQEALISWFEAASYKDRTIDASGDTVDPRQHDILRSWMARDTVDKRHLAKMNESMIKNLLSKESVNVGNVDISAANTLAYCCFDADQIKQIFSTVEMTGRIREEKLGQAIPIYEKKEDGTTTSVTACADGQIGNQTAPVDYAGNTMRVPRHKLALRHGEGFAIVVPAKTRLRSGTISEANLLVRLFQSRDGAVSE